MENVMYSSDEEEENDDDDSDDDSVDDSDDDSGSGGKDGSLNALASVIEKLAKFEQETDNADSSAFADHFGAFLKSMGKD